MNIPIKQAPAQDAIAARLLQREAMRRDAADVNTMSPAGLEGTLARISDEVTAEAAERLAEKAAQAPLDLGQ